MTRLPRPARLACALGGLAALAVALGPLDAAADDRLSAHMAQHVVVGILAPLLLALAAPVRALLGALPRSGGRALVRVLRTPVVRTLTSPPFAVALAVAVLVAAHLPACLEAVERHPLLHALDHAALFWSGLLVWVALLGADPVPAAPGAIGLMAALAGWMAPMALLGAVYSGADRVLVGAYASGGDALADQRSAGMVMWLGGTGVVVPVAIAVVLRALWREEERQRRRERAEGLS